LTNIIRLKEAVSTNLYLQDLLKKEKLPEGSVVITEYQTAGRGQAGNAWESARGKNLLCSMVLYPDFVDIENQCIISEVVSLAIVDTLASILREPQQSSATAPDTETVAEPVEVLEVSVASMLREPQQSSAIIKWPNDIYVGEKKIAGILIENNICGKTIESSIVGIGININQDFFESDAPNPVSLKQLMGKEYDLELLLKTLIEKIFKRYMQLMEKGKSAIHHDYLHHLFRKDGYHLYKSGNESFKAKIKTIKSSGHLVLETDQCKELVFAFKEVEFIL